MSDGTNEATQSITVNINNLNDNRPVAPTSETFTVAENQTSVGTISATDADGSTLTYSIEASDDGSSFQIGSSSGVLTFISAPDYETKNQYTLRVIVSDGSQTDSTNVTVNVTDVNESPSFTSSATFSADENQTTIGTVIASDPDGDTLTYSISDGGSVISINGSSGVLVLNSAPVYELKPRYPPVGSNESYRVTVSDGTNSIEQSLVININNLNDNSPVITSSATFSADENQTTIGTVVATDADGDTLIFSSSDTNIPINSSSGVLSFATAPDYEVQNSYTVTITASDGIPGSAGTNSTIQEITITINDLDD